MRRAGRHPQAPAVGFNDRSADGECANRCTVAALAERTNAAFDQAAKAPPKSRRLRAPLHALPEVFRNHRFPRRKPPGLSSLARQASQLVTAALLASPNTSSVPS